MTYNQQHVASTYVPLENPVIIRPTRICSNDCAVATMIQLHIIGIVLRRKPLRRPKRSMMTPPMGAEKAIVMTMMLAVIRYKEHIRSPSSSFCLALSKRKRRDTDSIQWNTHPEARPDSR